MNILFVMKSPDYMDQLGLMSIIGVTKKLGHDAFMCILDSEDILEKIEECQPSIIAYSASTGEHKYYLQANDLVKQKRPDIFTILGGPHVTFFPNAIQQSSLDAVCIGEGEYAFEELLNKIQNDEDIEGIKNLFFKGQNILPELRPLVQDLDSLPFPDRDLVYKNTEMGDYPLMKSFMASRGCPYNCTYCFNHAFRKLYPGQKALRKHSVDYVIEEVLRVKADYPLQFVKFYDDIFVLKVDEWLEEFVKKYKEKVNLPFLVLTRADVLNETIVKMLKDAGCHSISMSIESANDRIRNEILKRNQTKEQMLKAFQLCDKYGIYTFSNNILALPTSTIEDDIETVDFNIKCKVTFSEFPIFHPYPGTKLGDYCKEQGFFEGDYNSLHMSYMNLSPLSCFTDKQKNIQKNLGELGVVVVAFPCLRNVIINDLIYWPHNFIFFLMYYIVKAYLVTFKIYPFRYTFKTLAKMIAKSIKLERFKHSREKISLKTA